MIAQLNKIVFVHNDKRVIARLKRKVNIQRYGNTSRKIGRFLKRVAKIGITKIDDAAEYLIEIGGIAIDVRQCAAIGVRN